MNRYKNTDNQGLKKKYIPVFDSKSLAVDDKNKKSTHEIKCKII